MLGVVLLIERGAEAADRAVRDGMDAAWADGGLDRRGHPPTDRRTLCCGVPCAALF